MCVTPCTVHLLRSEQNAEYLGVQRFDEGTYLEFRPSLSGHAGHAEGIVCWSVILDLTTIRVNREVKIITEQDTLRILE